MHGKTGLGQFRLYEESPLHHHRGAFRQALDHGDAGKLAYQFHFHGLEFSRRLFHEDLPVSVRAAQHGVGGQGDGGLRRGSNLDAGGDELARVQVVAGIGDFQAHPHGAGGLIHGVMNLHDLSFYPMAGGKDACPGAGRYLGHDIRIDPCLHPDAGFISDFEQQIAWFHHLADNEIVADHRAILGRQQGKAPVRAVDAGVPHQLFDLFGSHAIREQARPGLLPGHAGFQEALLRNHLLAQLAHPLPVLVGHQGGALGFGHVGAGQGDELLVLAHLVAQAGMTGHHLGLDAGGHPAGGIGIELYLPGGFDFPGQGAGGQGFHPDAGHFHLGLVQPDDVFFLAMSVFIFFMGVGLALVILFGLVFVMISGRMCGQAQDQQKENRGEFLVHDALLSLLLFNQASSELEAPSHSIHARQSSPCSSAPAICVSKVCCSCKR